MASAKLDPVTPQADKTQASEPDAAPQETGPAEQAPIAEADIPAEEAASAPSTTAEPDFVHMPDEHWEPPVRRRRNPAKLWTMAAVGFLVAVSGAGAALWHFGTPDWAVNLGLAPSAEEPELLFYLPRPPERRKLPTGEEYFAFSGRIVNGGDVELPVPPIVVELRDSQDRLVFSWMTKADKAKLKPGEEARVSESRLDIPKNARNLALKFADGSE